MMLKVIAEESAEYIEISVKNGRPPGFCDPKLVSDFDSEKSVNAQIR